MRLAAVNGSAGKRRGTSIPGIAGDDLEPFPIALQSGTALNSCFDALSFAEPVSTSPESAPGSCAELT